MSTLRKYMVWTAQIRDSFQRPGHASQSWIQKTNATSMKRSKIMDKIVVIVNGCGGVGKDTFCDLVGKYINCITVSSVHPIKESARHAGWNGEEDDKSRKFLSDLKDACTE